MLSEKILSSHLQDFQLPSVTLLVVQQMSPNCEDQKKRVLILYIEWYHQIRCKPVQLRHPIHFKYKKRLPEAVKSCKIYSTDIEDDRCNFEYCQRQQRFSFFRSHLLPFEQVEK